MTKKRETLPASPPPVIEDQPMIHPNRLRHLRESIGLTQKELAAQIGMKQPTVNRHEYGNRSLDGFAIERYARFYGVTPYELFVAPGYTVESTPAPNAANA